MNSSTASTARASGIRGEAMSKQGKAKKLERLVKKANRQLLVDPDKMTPHDRKLWERGTTRLLSALKRDK